MAIRTLNPKDLIEFIPQFQNEDDGIQTKFQLRPGTMNDSLTETRLKFGGGTIYKTQEIHDRAWIDYFVDRVAKIENVYVGDTLKKEITDKFEIREILSTMPREFGAEFYLAVMESTKLDENEVKN